MTVSSYRQIQESTAALRQIPLATVIPIAFPGARGPQPGQGAGVVQWTLPEGTKVNVKTTSQSDLFKVWAGARAGQAGAGAINFLVATGVCADFAAAKAWLQDALPQLAITPMAPRTARPESPPPPFQLPHIVRNPAEAHDAALGYLTDVRQIPAPVVRLAMQSDPPAVLAGWGPKYGDYLLFPCWDHAAPLKGAHPTGALLRWRHADQTPPSDRFGGNPKPMAPGSHKAEGWWQLGDRNAATLIITEAPIDALSVVAALPTYSDRQPELPPDLAILALGGEAGFQDRQLDGHTRILIATDRDAAGDRFAALIRAATHPHQIVERIQPPAGCKDWNEAWQQHPAALQALWAQALGHSLAQDQEMER